MFMAIGYKFDFYTLLGISYWRNAICINISMHLRDCPLAR
jgi:hypothetical protein